MNLYGNKPEPLSSSKYRNLSILVENPSHIQKQIGRKWIHHWGWKQPTRPTSNGKEPLSAFTVSQSLFLFSGFSFSGQRSLQFGRLSRFAQISQSRLLQSKIKKSSPAFAVAECYLKKKITILNAKLMNTPWLQCSLHLNLYLNARCSPFSLAGASIPYGIKTAVKQPYLTDFFWWVLLGLLASFQR